MSTSIISDSMVMSSGPDGPLNIVSEVDFVKCDCCGLSEECTPSYIHTIRQRYGGKWICGLCGEAVKDEVLRCQSLDEAMARHLNFCNKIRASGPPQDPTLHLIRAMTHVLRKSLESPKSMPTGEPPTALARSDSCIPTLTLHHLHAGYKTHHGIGGGQYRNSRSKKMKQIA